MVFKFVSSLFSIWQQYLKWSLNNSLKKFSCFTFFHLIMHIFSNGLCANCSFLHLLAGYLVVYKRTFSLIRSILGSKRPLSVNQGFRMPEANKEHLYGLTEDILKWNTCTAFPGASCAFISDWGGKKERLEINAINSIFHMKSFLKPKWDIAFLNVCFIKLIRPFFFLFWIKEICIVSFGQIHTTGFSK